MSGREIESKKYEDNPLLNWPDHAGILRTAFNMIILTLTKFLPLRLKNVFLRALGVSIGPNTAVGLSVQFDIFHPEKISIGENSVIGYGTTILTHETTTERFSTGEVKIGDDVLIGANTTILPGVEIADGATVSAHSLVNRDVGEAEKVGGVPIREIGE